MPEDKFEAGFGLSYKKALADGVVYNAIDGCKLLGVDAAGLDALWAKAKKVKLGGGFYCGLIEVPGKKSVYVMNGFFMEMRSKFVAPGTSIHYYVVEFDPATLSWADFRAKVLGPTDPKDAPDGALRGTIYKDWKSLGLAAVPNVGDNGVHASAVSHCAALSAQRRANQRPSSETPLRTTLPHLYSRPSRASPSA